MGVRVDRHPARLVAVALLAGAALLLPAVPATAQTACEVTPTIVRTAVGTVSPAGAPVEAEIDPHGRETAYEIAVVWQEEHPPHGGPPPAGTGAVKGHIPAGSATTTAHVLLTGLEPGSMYWYEVIATNVGGEARAQAAFSYFYSGLFPEGEGEPPYRPVASCWVAESGQLAAERTSREARERQARELQEREAALAREREAAGQREAAARAARCVVPNLRGESLRAARRALAHAHCRLGAVRRPPGSTHGLVVTRQNPAHGRALGAGARVAVTLGRRH